MIHLGKLPKNLTGFFSENPRILPQKNVSEISPGIILDITLGILPETSPGLPLKISPYVPWVISTGVPLEAPTVTSPKITEKNPTKFYLKHLTGIPNPKVPLGVALSIWFA